MASRLSSLLVRDGLVGVKRMEKAYQRQVIYGGSLDTILLEMSLVPEDRLTQYLALASGLPPADRDEGATISPEALAVIDKSVAEQFRAVPLAIDGEVVRVLVCSPLELSELEDLADLLDRPLQPLITPEYRWHLVFAAAYGLDPPARFTSEKKERRDAIVAPSRIGVGRFVLRLSHQNFPAIIVFDPKSPRYKEYKGIKYFPVDLGYRYEAAFVPNPKVERVTIMSTQGTPRKAVRAGWFDLMVGKTAVRLEADRLLEPGVGENDLSIFFRDATSGKESYGFGRYVDPVKQKNGKYLIDFNMAYNPACAFSDYYNCPVPPKENTLRVAIRAGEMDSHYH